MTAFWRSIVGVLKLTKRAVDATPIPHSGESWHWDTELKGLGLKVTPAGRRAFVLKYRIPGDRATKKLTIGAYGAITVEQARLEARRLLSEVAKGDDPARARSSRREAPTVATALVQYLAEQGVRWKPRTRQEYRRQTETFVVPAIGRRLVQEVERGDIGSLLRRLQDRPVLANRVLAFLSGFFTWTIRSGLRPDEKNPCRFIPKHPESSRTRFLSGEELARLGAALREAEKGSWTGEDGKPLPSAPWQSIAAIRLLLFTGARKTEILDLTWKNVDVERGQLHLPDTKTGESIRPLSGPALEILQSLPAGAPNDRVVPGSGGRRHDPKPTWQAVRHLAGLPDVRIHDLRHTVASRSQHAGDSLLVTASLLGHRDLDTTRKYAHLIPDPLRVAADRVAGDMAALLDGRTTPALQFQRGKHGTA